MIPKTYVVYPTTWVRVCQACDWLSNAFCMALLQGRYEDAVSLYGTVSRLGLFGEIILSFSIGRALTVMLQCTTGKCQPTHKLR
jgi:hypothetical protein